MATASSGTAPVLRQTKCSTTNTKHTPAVAKLALLPRAPTSTNRGIAIKDIRTLSILTSPTPRDRPAKTSSSKLPLAPPAGIVEATRAKDLLMRGRMQIGKASGMLVGRREGRRCQGIMIAKRRSQDKNGSYGGFNLPPLPL
ncbi:hypothetical protein HDU96_001434 [Phlyctochytrium bullatum]|nr:hypothetical protein HDU96_001434 [Phlyctochytrium bullatum]